MEDGIFRYPDGSLLGFLLQVPGEPRGKGRPRFTRSGRAYTDEKTVAAEEAIRWAWRYIGSPRFEGRVPLRAHIKAGFARPNGHYRKNGELGSVGLREPFPMKVPDCDNLAKIMLDSLNKLAWQDDAQFVVVVVEKQWVKTPYTTLWVYHAV